jgi:hypothetical protein
VFSFFACFAIVPLSAEELDVEVGKWEWQGTVNMAGEIISVPVYSTCLTKKDLIPKQSQENKYCKMVENKITKNRIDWKMECSGGNGQSTIIGHLFYNKTTAKGKIKTETSGMTIIANLIGQHIGSCE